MDILAALGIDPGTIATIVAVVLFFERIGKLIPDDATGILGLVRKASKILGGYVENQKK